MDIIAQKPRKKFLSEAELQQKDLWITRKYRGFTGVATVKNGLAEIRSGNAVSSFRLPHLEFKHDGIFIGEVYTPDIEDENNLQTAINTYDFGKIKFACFDVLRCDKQDLTTAPLRERIKYIPEICGEGVHIATETKARTRDELMAQIVNNGWEGIVAADMNAAHHLNMGTNGVRQRGEAWKLKPSLSMEFLVLSVQDNVAHTVMPNDPTKRVHKFGSFNGTLNPQTIRSGDLIEVTFCSIDRDGNFVHPVVQTVRRPQIDGPDL